MERRVLLILFAILWILVFIWFSGVVRDAGAETVNQSISNAQQAETEVHQQNSANVSELNQRLREIQRMRRNIHNSNGVTGARSLNNLNPYGTITPPHDDGY